MGKKVAPGYSRFKLHLVFVGVLLLSLSAQVALAHTLAADPPGKSGTAGSQGNSSHTDSSNPNPPGNANSSGHGANVDGPFTSKGGESQTSNNGNGGGQANGKPGAGTVGNADNKNPPGQSVNDNNKGYECDKNKGIGQGNPAHTSDCSDPGPSPSPSPSPSASPSPSPSTQALTDVCRLTGSSWQKLSGVVPQTGDKPVSAKECNPDDPTRDRDPLDKGYNPVSSPSVNAPLVVAAAPPAVLAAAPPPVPAVLGEMPIAPQASVAGSAPQAAAPALLPYTGDADETTGYQGIVAAGLLMLLVGAALRRLARHAA